MSQYVDSFARDMHIRLDDADMQDFHRIEIERLREEHERQLKLSHDALSQACQSIADKKAEIKSLERRNFWLFMWACAATVMAIYFGAVAAGRWPQ